MHKAAGVIAVTSFAAALPAQEWSRAEAHPSTRVSAVVTHDRARDRVVMFGHANGDDVTWEWNGAAWSPRHTTSVPAAISSHGLVYDDLHRVTWLFNFASRQTWSYDGREWSQVSVPMAPPHRSEPWLEFDRQRNVAVMFGGAIDHHTPLSDTWEWDGSAWLQRQPPVVPPARARHAMTYDPVAGHVLMYGGTTMTSAGLLDDTWAWDGTFWVQQQVFVRPAARTDCAMAFDPTLQQPLLFGGRDVTQSYDETWTWNGANWQRLLPATVPAVNFDQARLVPSSAAGELVLYLPRKRQTWTWDGTDWTLVQSWPAPRLNYSAAATDRARGRVVVHAGTPGGGREIWEWDGGQWHQALSSPAPVPRELTLMAHDPIRARTVLHGGRAGTLPMTDTWEWDGSQWTQHTPATVPQISPWAFNPAAMYFDATLGRCVLIARSAGGVFGSFHEWTWTGVDWQSRPAQSIGEFRGACFDEARSVSVAITSLGMFERGAGAWVQVAGPGAFLGNFDGKGFAYDAARQTCVGVYYATSPAAWSTPAYEWDGTSWAALPPVEGYGFYAARILVEDPTRGRLTLIGGNIDATRFWNLTDKPALGETFGSACGGSAGTVTVTARGLPRTGNAAFGVDVDHALPGALVLLGVSIGEGNTPINGGCSWYFGSPIASHVLLANASGFAAIDLAIPSGVTFRGLTLAAQAFALDPAGPHLGAFAASAGLRIRIGD